MNPIQNRRKKNFYIFPYKAETISLTFFVCVFFLSLYFQLKQKSKNQNREYKLRPSLKCGLDLKL